jgi:hypothetical protein
MSLFIDGKIFVGMVVATGIGASGLVDATKAYFGGVNRIGFAKIKRQIIQLTPGAPNGLPQIFILESLYAHWANGAALSKQISTAKSLVMMHLSPANAAMVAASVNVDPAILCSMAAKRSAGIELDPPESDLSTRFDLIVSALLDAAYQKAEQEYSNGTRFYALVFAVLLALIEMWVLHSGARTLYLGSDDMNLALIVGLLAAPIAPIAKDASKAVGAAIRSRVEKEL